MIKKTIAKKGLRYTAYDCFHYAPVTGGRCCKSQMNSNEGFAVNKIFFLVCVTNGSYYGVMEWGTECNNSNGKYVRFRCWCNTTEAPPKFIWIPLEEARRGYEALVETGEWKSANIYRIVYPDANGFSRDCESDQNYALTA